MLAPNPPILAAPIVLLIAAACYGAGSQILLTLRVQPESFSGGVAFGTALGLGILSYLVLGIGLGGWLSTTSVLILLGVVAALGLSYFARRPRQSRETRPPRTDATQRRGLLGTALLAVIFLAAIVTLIGALSPPLADDWDGLAYHLADPRLYIEQGKIFPIDFESHSNFPFTIEMLYTVGLALKSVSIAKGFSWILWIIGGLGAYGLARTLAGESVGAWCGLAAAVLFLACPIVLWEATSSYVDVAGGAFLVLSAEALLLWRRGTGRGWLVAAGLFAGWSLGTKMTLALAVVVLIVCALWWSRASLGKRAGHALAFAAIAAAVASPWYIKSYLSTGNPVYPFYYNVFDGRNWSSENAQIYAAQQASFGVKERGLRQLIAAPWDLVAHPDVYYDKVSSDPMVIYLFSLGLGFVVSLPVLALGLRPEREMIGLLALVAISFVVWFFQVQYTRYLVPLLPVASALIAACAGSLAQRRRTLRPVALAFCVFAIGLSIFHVGLAGRWTCADRLGVVVGREPQEDYLRARLRVFPMAEFVNRELPTNAKIIMYNLVFGFYFDRDYMWGDPRHHTLIAYDSMRDAGDLVGALRGLGVTHMLIDEELMPDSRAAEGWVRLVYQAISTGRAVPVYSERGYALFELTKR
jgi:hypothetical protein